MVIRCPLPVQFSVLSRPAGADVHHEVEIVELEALGHVRLAQLRPHVRVLAHERERPVHDLPELVS
jgi:hypothetical protein